MTDLQNWTEADVERVARTVCSNVAGRDPNLPHHDRFGKATGLLNWQAYRGDAKIILSALPRSESREAVVRETVERCAKVADRQSAFWRSSQAFVNLTVSEKANRAGEADTIAANIRALAPSGTGEG